MPFIKNLKDEICLALEPEVSTLLEKGWKLLTEAEDAAHREELRLIPELTSAAAQEEARIKAGLYKAMSVVAKGEKAVAGAKTAVVNASKVAVAQVKADKAAKVANKGVTNGK